MLQIVRRWLRNVGLLVPCERVYIKILVCRLPSRRDGCSCMHARVWNHADKSKVGLVRDYDVTGKIRSFFRE